MLNYDEFCLALGLQAYDDGAELGSSLELHENYMDAYKPQIERKG